MIAAGLVSALWLLASPTGAAPQSGAESMTAASTHFAPPLNRQMVYRVTTRRIGRDNSILSFSLVYALEWRRAGRGYQLGATLERIESDAGPQVTRALTAVLQPLVGEEMTYLVAADGSSVDLADADRLWERALARTADAGAGAGQVEAKRIATMIAALPAAERDRLASADIRALVAPAGAILSAGNAASVSVTQQDGLRRIAKVEPPVSSAQGALAVQTDMIWTIDTATGLVVHEQKQSWIAEPGSDARTLIEERVRALDITG